MKETIYFAVFKSAVGVCISVTEHYLYDHTLEEFHYWLKEKSKDLEKEYSTSFSVQNIQFIQK